MEECRILKIFLRILEDLFFDIETEPLPYNEFPAPEEARAPISLITIHDSLTNEYTTFGTKEFTGELPNDLKVFYIHCEDEYELLESFLRYIEKDHPDILSAWNSNFSICLIWSIGLLKF